ncbi:MAG: putative phosphoribosyl transferase [Campylobacterota bacterium]|nr:putative phosphoribosyl transferase [Campylobacterota bacterium]
MILFENREDAFEQLTNQMPLRQMKKEGWIVLAISEGGVYFSKKIAKLIDARHDYLFTEKITAPNNKECVIAMISETQEIVINDRLIDSFDITYDYVYGEAKRKYEEKILTYLYKYRKGEMIKSLKDKNVLLVDEGADTGMTLMASLKTALALNVAKVAVALPIVAESIAQELEKIVDGVYFAHEVKNYIDLYAYYKELPKFNALSMTEEQTIAENNT